MTENAQASHTAEPGGDVIRDAACLVVADFCNGPPRLLMGQRLDTQVFLPGKWVFPGGRVDADDHTLAAGLAAEYCPANLSAGIRPFALAAVRELFEETGLIAGARAAMPTCVLPPGWTGFAATGHEPRPLSLAPLARAITPPGRVRRYDTWFFLTSRADLSPQAGSGDGELRGLDWFTLDDAHRLDLPNITRLVLDDVAGLLQNYEGLVPNRVPFYRHDGCGFRRTLIGCDSHDQVP